MARLAVPGASSAEQDRLASRMQRLIVDREWHPQPVLHAVVATLDHDVTWTARVLTTVLVKKLWLTRVHGQVNGDQQFATHLRLVGHRPNRTRVTTTLAWRLAVDDTVWGKPGSGPRRAEAGLAEDHCDPVDDIGYELIDASDKLGLRDIPVVAGSTYFPTRGHWMRRGIDHVLEWPPNEGRSPVDDFPAEHYRVEQLSVRTNGVHDVKLVHGERYRELIVTATAPSTRQGRRIRIWLSNIHACPQVDLEHLAEILRLGHLRFDLHDDNQRYRELGLDGFQGRSYDAWHRHAALVSLAFAAEQLSTGN
ncbi:MAG: hypothetical protein ACR2LK_15695 [Solirubrobacteraceae bacterium]